METRLRLKGNKLQRWGTAVDALGKHGTQQISHLARTLANGWKNGDAFMAAQATKKAEENSLDKENKDGKKHEENSLEIKLVANKRKIQKGYQQAQNAKKKIRLVECCRISVSKSLSATTLARHPATMIGITELKQNMSPERVECLRLYVRRYIKNYVWLDPSVWIGKD